MPIVTFPKGMVVTDELIAAIQVKIFTCGIRDRMAKVSAVVGHDLVVVVVDYCLTMVPVLGSQGLPSFREQHSFPSRGSNRQHC